MIRNPVLEGVPLLVLANKQDMQVRKLAVLFDFCDGFNSCTDLYLHNFDKTDPL